MLQQLELPLDATGYGEFELQAAGLYGDSLMLGYSTTGQFTGSVRQGVMTFNDKLSETSTHPWSETMIRDLESRGACHHVLEVDGQVVPDRYRPNVGK